MDVDLGGIFLCLFSEDLWVLPQSASFIYVSIKSCQIVLKSRFLPLGDPTTTSLLIHYGNDLVFNSTPLHELV